MNIFEEIAESYRYNGVVSIKALEDDIITDYGEFTGLEKITRALTSTTDELPRIEVKYADLVEE